MCAQEKAMLLRASEKVSVLHALDTSFFKLLEDRVRQKLLRTSADCVYCNEDASDSPQSFVRFVQILSVKTAKRLKSSVLVADQVHVVLLNFVKEYKKSLIQSRHDSMAYFRLKLKRVNVRKGRYQGTLRISMCYSTS